MDLVLSPSQRFKGVWGELVGGGGANLSVLAPALTLRSGNPIRRH